MTGRLTALIIACVLLGAAAVLVSVLSSSGSSKPSSATSSTTIAAKHARARHHGSASGATTTKRAATVAANPAEVNVAVLNGTETTGLAHRIAAQLSQSGYTRATPLDGRPSGANQATVVEYTSGHLTAAEGVAHALGVSTTQPLEAAVSSLSGSATVVVIVGLDKAATAP